MSSKQNKNSQQDIMIAENRKDICWLKKATARIEKQVFNEIPHQIDSIKDKLMWGFIIGIASILILQVVLKLF